MANDGNIEVEIQVQVEKVSVLKDFLKKKAEYIGQEHQIDKYFSPKHKDFLKTKPISEWLRLRNSSGKLSVNYKYWHRDKKGKTDWCDEYETSIGEIDQLEKIFSALRVKHIITVDKTRKIYHYKDFEISLDSIKGLGDFVEIEFKGKSGTKTPAEITGNMVKFLKDLGCGKILRNYNGYPYQILFPKEVEVEEYN